MKKKQKTVPGFSSRLAILGGGNIGVSIAKGLVQGAHYHPEQVIITRRRSHLLGELAAQKFVVGSDNRDAVRRAKTVIVAVGPQQLIGLLREIRPDLVPNRHLLISVVSGVGINEISRHIKSGVSIVRAMTNISIEIREAMTCLSAPQSAIRGIPPEADQMQTGIRKPQSFAGGGGQSAQDGLDAARSIFDSLGKTLIINEELMLPATALCGCGLAFFLRAIRAASQGGIQIGFHSDEALIMAAQTARGAASLLLNLTSHPEQEIDKVTTPMGCTIEGLNEMEHHGFSSAMIRGIITSNEKASKLRQ